MAVDLVRLRAAIVKSQMALPRGMIQIVYEQYAGDASMWLDSVLMISDLLAKVLSLCLLLMGISTSPICLNVNSLS